MNANVYEKKIVAFVDILGFSTMIEDSKANTLIRRDILNAMKIICREREMKKGIDGLEVTTFSDSAVISYPVNKHGSLFYILIDIIHLQLFLGRLGIMIRGGISIGDVYHEENIVFGPAMNEAYRLENKVAVSPRVVLTRETLMQGIKDTTDHGPYAYKYDFQEIMELVKPDDYNEDGNDQNVFFVDFLSQEQELTQNGDEYYEWLTDFRTAIVSGLNRYSKANPDLKKQNKIVKDEAEKIFKKYRWMLNYWNSIVTDDSTYKPTPDLDQEARKQFFENYKKLKISKRFPYY